MANSSTNFDNLPREMVGEIMSRLPADSLMECKCLNKFWYSVIKCLIDDLEFVAKHLHHAQASPATLLVYHSLWPEDPTKEYRTYELVSELLTSAPSCYGSGNRGNARWLSDDLNLPHDLFGVANESVYHCNGLICVIKDSKTIMLGNLTLRKFYTFRPETDTDIRSNKVIGTGFGCDIKDGSYKIVSVLENMKAEVFTPGTTTNTWREIDISVEIEPTEALDYHVYLNGNCFWLIFGSTPVEVLCFNVYSEEFDTIPLPYELDMFDFDELCTCLTVRNDSVCLFWYPEDEELESGYSILVWELVMDKDGTSEDDGYSWIKCLDIKPFKNVYFPLTFWKNDELLLRNRSKRMKSYNIRTRELKKTHVSRTMSSSSYLGPYVKSLVSIKGKI